MKRITSKYPPPLAKLAAVTAALVALLMTGQGWAQTTVTSSGREGQTACVGYAEVNAENFSITALSTSSMTVMAPQVTWSQVVSQLGDRQAPTNSIISVNVFNAKTGASVGNSGAIGTISSLSPTYAGGSVTRTGLAARTLYRVELDAGIPGGLGQIHARRCFMTGGTYTMAVNPASGQTSGCFSISPRTPQDVRNCWCARRNTLPLFGDGTDNSNFLDSIGCR